MWSEILPYVFQVAAVLATAAVLGGFKFIRTPIRKLLALPDAFEKFEIQNETDHATVRSNVKQVQRSQDNLGRDLLALTERQNENTVQLATQDIRLTQLEQ
jgi:hypothetical protein